MKNAIRKILTVIFAFICFWGIMIFFIISGGITEKLGKHLRILPTYTGGEVAADFFDTAGDDNGNGNLVYPANQAFAEGSLDLIRYTVHEPVIQAKWQPNEEYWQLDLEYKNAVSNVRNIMVYIDLDNVPDGSTDTLTDSAENVTFSPEHPWDIAVWANPTGTKVYDSNKTFICNAECYELAGGKTVKVRIPLQNEYLQAVYGSTKTYHYVLTGGYSQFDRGGFMPIEKRRSVSHGGTKSAKEYNALIPKVYDVLGENAQLGTWNAEDFSKAVLIPVEAQMHPFAVTGKVWKGNRKADTNDDAFVEKVFNEYAKYAPKTGNSYFENAEESTKMLKQKITENPDDLVSMAYYGSCLAVQGGQSSVLQAVALVNEAFEVLDKAAELARGTPYEIEVLMNRGSVASSVPNDVFQKAETAAADFMRIIELYKTTFSTEELNQPEVKSAIAYCYVMASRAYKTLGKQTDEILALQEAKKLLEYN